MKKFDIEGLVVIDGDDSYHGVMALIKRGFPAIGIPGTIDSNIPGTDFAISFDTVISTALESVGRIRDTATSHAHAFVIEVMGRNVGDIALWSGMTDGANETIIPEHDLDMKSVTGCIQEGRDRGKRHCLIILAEGVMGGDEFTDKLPGYGDFHTRVLVLGHVVRGGSSSICDHVLAGKFRSYAVELLKEGEGDLCIGILDNQVTATDTINMLENNKHKPGLSPYKLNYKISS